jgi:perosamine synthetase
MDFNHQPIIPMSSPDLTDAERQAVQEVLNTPYLSMGPYIQAFEDAFRNYLGCKYALAVNSGTAGLHLSVIACKIADEDLVITTPFSFVASTNVLLYERAVPIFVDVDPLTGNIDPKLVHQAASDLANGGSSAQRWLPRKSINKSKPAKAILAVDVFGQTADYDALRMVADSLNLSLIEDACEALGAGYKNRMAGTLGDCAVFAFYPNKQITTGEGGLIVTDDDDLWKTMSALRNQGRAVGDTWLQHTHLGYNYRMDELSAALGTVQMSRLDDLLTARARVAGWYEQYLKGVTGIQVPYVAPHTTHASWFVYVIRLEEGQDRAALAERLREHGIPVRPYFSAIHLQPYLVERFGYQAGDFPICENLSQRGLALPFSGKMTEEQVERVCYALMKCL